MRFQITNSSVVKLLLDEFHVGFCGIKEWGSCMKRVGTKSGKKKKIWANFRSCTGTPPAEANLYRYRSKLYRYTPTKCNLYRYRSEVYQYRCAQNAQNVVFLYN